MEFIIVAFRSRAHTIKFFNLLSAHGVAMEIVNTPKEAGVGCGLSVKIKPQSFEFVKRAVLNLSLSSFAGFFIVKDMGGRRIVKSI
jgi:hypothetical protein